MLFGDLWHNQLWHKQLRHNQLRQWLVEGCYKLMFGIWHKYSSWFKVAAVSSEYNNNSDYHISSLLGEKLPQHWRKAASAVRKTNRTRCQQLMTVTSYTSKNMHVVNVSITGISSALYSRSPGRYYIMYECNCIVPVNTASCITIGYP